jgi:hypothetical protein
MYIKLFYRFFQILLYIAISVQLSDVYSAVIRPEDQGEDFSQLDDAENFKHLTESDNKIDRWKAAKVLGTRYLEGDYIPTLSEQKKIDEYVAFLLTQFKTDNPGDAGDTSVQLQRLWSLAVPGLLQGLKSKDRTTWNVALEHLVRMRSEDVIEKLIKEYEKSNEEEYKRVLLDALGKMCTMYDNRLDYRKMMSSKKSKELADKLIIPFLENIFVSETGEQTKNSIQGAKKFIETPIDSRIRQIDSTGQPLPIIEPDEGSDEESEEEVATNTKPNLTQETLVDLPEKQKNAIENIEIVTENKKIEEQKTLSSKTNINYAITIVTILLLGLVTFFLFRKKFFIL